MSMTLEEREAQNAKSESERPMREWKREILASDKLVTARTIDEIYEALSDSVKAKIPKETKDKFTLRKQIRARKPG